jgi:hypothetical protein
MNFSLDSISQALQNAANWLQQLGGWDGLFQALVQGLGNWDASSMPSIVWAGLALWLLMRLADGAQRLGAMRTTAYWWSGALLAAAAVWLVPLLWPAHTGVTSLAATAPAGGGASPTDAPNGLSAPLQSLQWLFDLALAWVLFTVGQRMDMRWLMRNRALAFTAVLEFALTAIAVTWALQALGVPPVASGLGGVIAAHSAPVVLASFMPQWHADGQVSARAMHIGGINTLLAALCVPLLISLGEAWQQSAGQGAMLPWLRRSGWELAQPLLLLLLSLAVGVVLGRWIDGWIEQQKRLQRERPKQAHGIDGVSQEIAWVAAACVCAGLAQWWGAPAWAACLALGMGLRSPLGAAMPIVPSAGKSLGGLQAHQGSLMMLSQMLLFAFSAACVVIGGMEIIAWLQSKNAQAIAHIGSDIGVQMAAMLGLVLMLRLLCKILMCTLTAHWAGLRWQQGLALGLALQPLSMSGLALLLMALPLLGATSPVLALALWVALCVSDWLSPLALRALLRRTGELTQDEPEIAGMHSRSSTAPMQIDTTQMPPRDGPPTLPPGMVPTLTIREPELKLYPSYGPLPMNLGPVR